MMPQCVNQSKPYGISFYFIHNVTGMLELQDSLLWTVRGQIPFLFLTNMIEQYDIGRTRLECIKLLHRVLLEY